MSEPIAKQVLSIIETAPNDTIFASVDFSSLAIGDTIRKTLNRLEEQQVLVKLLPSIYKKRDFQDVSPESVAKAIARQNNWTIVPTSNFAKAKVFMHSMLIETFEFLSTGSSKKYDLGEFKLVFTQSDLSYYEGMSEITVCVLETLKNLTKKGCTQKALQKLSTNLTPQDLDTVYSQTRSVETWLIETIKELNKYKSEECAFAHQHININNEVLLHKKITVAGTENFESFFNEDELCYYVDKTKFFDELLTETSPVNLFTRPRRFGKTLLLTTLCDFCKINLNNPDDISYQDKRFKNLEVYKNKDLCDRFMGKIPVLFISFKEELKSTSKEECEKSLVFNLCKQFYAQYAEIENQIEKTGWGDFFRCIKSIAKRNSSAHENYKEIQFCMISILQTMCDILYDFFGKKVLLLIDEYDTPLTKIAYKEYYEDFKATYIGILGSALKSNFHLQKAFLTGCFQLALCSGSSDLNNIKIYGMNDVGFEDLFGFTPDEVDSILTTFNLRHLALKFKIWYDGYRFNNHEIYCPWDVISYIQDLIKDPKSEAKSYWGATGGTDMIKNLYKKAPNRYLEPFNALIHGQSIDTYLPFYMTYEMIKDEFDNGLLWPLLYSTGYLTIENTIDSFNQIQSVRMVNFSVKQCFRSLIQSINAPNVPQNQKVIISLIDNLKSGNTRMVTAYLMESFLQFLSYYDFTKDTPKEIVYHSFINGRLTAVLNKDENNYVSNSELGEGRCDISFVLGKLSDIEGQIGIIIELKATDTPSLMSNKANEALEQIENRKYHLGLFANNPLVTTVKAYGICCCKKDCRVAFKEFKYQQ